MEDFRLKIFVNVAKEGSFTKAASALGISQPAVSQNISELEKTTGVRLFERLKGEVVLTDQGKVFIDYAEKILKCYEDANIMFAALPATNVKISASEEIYRYFVTPVLENSRESILKSPLKESSSKMQTSTSPWHRRRTIRSTSIRTA